MNTIFIDVDGVLNSKPFCDRTGKEFDESMVERLGEIVHKTGSQLVLCSSWASLRDADDSPTAKAMYGRLVKVLAAYGMEIADITDISLIRPKAVAHYLKLHPEITAYAIIDDDFSRQDYAKYGLGENLVQTAYFVHEEQYGGFQYIHQLQVEQLLA